MWKFNGSMFKKWIIGETEIGFANWIFTFEHINSVLFGDTRFNYSKIEISIWNKLSFGIDSDDEVLNSEDLFQKLLSHAELFDKYKSFRFKSTI